MRQVPNNRPLLTAALASIGSGLEYYAFICFALQATVFSKLFFGGISSRFALLETLATFAAGSVMTFFGGFFFGVIADRIGRKKVFLAAVGLMTVATVGIGLLPVGFGLYGSALLLLFRILQGTAQGAELPGAITFICEHAQDRARGLSTGLLFLGVGLGAGLATLVNFLINHYFTAAEITAYAWRIPFLAALVLGGVGYLLRRKTLETPIFLKQHQEVKTFFTAQLPGLKILQGLGLVWLGAVMVSLGLFWPSFLTQYLHYQETQVFLAMTCAFVITALFLPVFGYLSDRLGRKNLYLISLILLGLTLYPMLQHLQTGTSHYLFLFSFWYYLMIVMLASNYPVMLAELFPTRIRYQSVALSYAGCYAIAGLIPVLAGAILLKFSVLPVLIGLLYVSWLISFLAWWVYREHQGSLDF